MTTLILSESYLEYWGNVLLDLDPQVIDLATQPFSIRYRFKGRWRIYTPDTLVRMRDGRLYLIEFKYIEEYENDPELRAKINCLREIFKRRGYTDLLLLTEREICEEPRLENSLCLHRHATSNEPGPKDVRTLHRLMGDQAISIGKLLRYASKGAFYRDALWYLMGRNIIEVDRTEPITPQTRVRWSPDHGI
ncbi:TnsA endonuclease N-terminal domain-containing protein [Halioglobus japonicus]